jgi:hypothetical protein
MNGSVCRDVPTKRKNFTLIVRSMILPHAEFESALVRMEDGFDRERNNLSDLSSDLPHDRSARPLGLSHDAISPLIPKCHVYPLGLAPRQRPIPGVQPALLDDPRRDRLGCHGLGREPQHVQDRPGDGPELCGCRLPLVARSDGLQLIVGVQCRITASRLARSACVSRSACIC